MANSMLYWIAQAGLPRYVRVGGQKREVLWAVQLGDWYWDFRPADQVIQVNLFVPYRNELKAFWKVNDYAYYLAKHPEIKLAESDTITIDYLTGVVNTETETFQPKYPYEPFNLGPWEEQEVNWPLLAGAGALSLGLIVLGYFLK